MTFLIVFVNLHSFSYKIDHFDMTLFGRSILSLSYLRIVSETGQSTLAPFNVPACFHFRIHHFVASNSNTRTVATRLISNSETPFSPQLFDYFQTPQRQRTSPGYEHQCSRTHGTKFLP